MKILISNDDGVYAPGIRALYKRLAQDHEVLVVAPLEERSTTGHTLSLDVPLRLAKVEDNVYGCSGYPADCTLMGIGHISDIKPDIVISGINRGANLGQDIYYSGTMAAAREAVFHGIPAIAVSSVCDLKFNSKENVYYDDCAEIIARMLSYENILEQFRPLHVINVNVPNLELGELKGSKMTSLGFRRYSEDISARKDFRGRDYYWVGGVYNGYEDGDYSDCHAVEDRYVSVSLLNLLSRPAEKEEVWTKIIATLL